MKDTTRQARAIFRAAFDGNPNFFTPVVIECDMASKTLAYEISRGEAGDGMFEDFYGVTVVEKTFDGSGTKHRFDLCKPCGSVEEARAHVDTFREVPRAVH